MVEVEVEVDDEGEVEVDDEVEAEEPPLKYFKLILEISQKW